MKRFINTFFAHTFLLLLFVLSLNATAQSDTAKSDVIKIFEDKMKAYQGKVVYVDFWASWCGPCVKSFPWMHTMQNKYRDNLQVVTINLDSEKALATQFLLQHTINFDVIYDSEGVLAQKFKLKGMPNSFIFNKSGELVSAHVGFSKSKQEEYEQALIALMGK